MDSTIKRYADSGEIEHLRYIFLDSLDIDPTFESYKEDFDYCMKKNPGLFEEHKELSPFKSNPSEWNDSYWITIKKDLKKNYSLERFKHMMDVAKVVYDDKVKRIELERKERKDEAERRQKELDALAQENKTVTINRAAELPQNEPQIKITHNTVENFEHNRSQHDYNAAQFNRVKNAEAENARRDKELEDKNKEKGDQYRKKALGTAALIIAIIVVVVLLILKNR